MWRTIGLALVLLASTLVLAPASASATASAPAVVTMGPLVANPVASTFWAVDAHIPIGAPDPTLAGLVNATPITQFRYGVMSEQTNQTIDVAYSNNGHRMAAQMNASQFVTWCEWIRCVADWQLPAETNDSGAVALTVRYVEQNLSFRPAFWSIGNEPAGWKHYNIPWTKWRSTDLSTCSATCFAQEVHRMVPAIRSVDPSAQIIGLQLAGCGSSPYLSDVVRVNGPNLSAVACHEYPASGIANPTLAQFLGSLQGPNSLPLKIPRARSTIHSACRTCSLPLFVDEYNAENERWSSVYQSSYPDVPFLAASLIQAVDLNLSQFALFDLEDPTPGLAGSDMVGTNDSPRWTYWLYADFFENLPMSSVYRLSLNTTVNGTYGELFNGGNRSRALFVNTNTTTALNLTLNQSGVPCVPIGNATAWGQNESEPVTLNSTNLTGSVTIPPEGLLLLRCSTNSSSPNGTALDTVPRSLGADRSPLPSAVPANALLAPVRDAPGRPRLRTKSRP
jgi:hypothetical protein